MPLISVIVPCYNLESWIRECLDSVLTQSYADWECVVVDDESKDGSPEILDEYAAKDARFRVIHQKNAGEGGARNAGLAVAQGEWVFFLDGDDIMAPGAMACLLKIINEYPNENLIRFGFERFDDEADVPLVNHKGRGCGPIDVSRKIAFDDYYVYVWQFLFKRSLIEGMRFDRYKRGADRTFIVPVLCYRASSFVATGDVCYLYRKRVGSAMSARPSVQVMQDELSHRADIIETIDQSGKVMPYRGTYSLERYCIREYQKLALSYSREEQEQLIAWFYHELPRLRRAKDYSLKAKICCILYAILRGPNGWRFVSVVLPKFYACVRRVLKS